MIKISVKSLVGIIRISGKVGKENLSTEEHLDKCKTLISNYLGLPDLFNVTYKDDSLHKKS